MFINHYEILGVEPEADLVQITAAWKRLLKKYHPDLNQDDRDATEQTILVNKAYEILSDSTKRKKFDLQLENRRRQTDSQQDSATGNNGEPERNRGTTSQSSPQSYDRSFTSSADTNKPKGQGGFLIYVTGIVLGAITAIPIGRIENQVDGCSFQCNVTDGYVHKLLLFQDVDTRKQKLKVEFTVKKGKVDVGLRPANLAPRGATVDMAFQNNKKYSVEIGWRTRLQNARSMAFLPTSLRSLGYWVFIRFRFRVIVASSSTIL